VQDPADRFADDDGHPQHRVQRRGGARQLDQRVVEAQRVRLARPAAAVDLAGEAAVAGDALADHVLDAGAEGGDEGQAGRGRAGQLGARVVEQDAAHLRRHELVGALEDLAQGRVEAHVPVLGVLIDAARAHEEARDLLGRQREDGPGRRQRNRDGELLGPDLRRDSGLAWWLLLGHRSFD